MCIPAVSHTCLHSVHGESLSYSFCFESFEARLVFYDKLINNKCKRIMFFFAKSSKTGPICSMAALIADCVWSMVQDKGVQVTEQKLLFSSYLKTSHHVTHMLNTPSAVLMTVGVCLVYLLAQCLPSSQQS